MAKQLLDGLAFLADDAFVDIAHTLAFVGLGRVEAANLRSDLADDLPVGPLDSELSVFLDRHLDLVRNSVIDGVGVTETEINSFALNSGFESHTLNFQFLDESFADTSDHIINQCTAEAVEGLNMIALSLTADQEPAVFKLDAGMQRELPVELSLGSFHVNVLAFNLDL